MSDQYPQLEVVRKGGAEVFHADGASLNFDLLGFWQWSSSDLLNNVLRGLLAEYIVAQDLGVATGTRTEWDAYDLLSKKGIKVEVKSAAYLQTWKQNSASTIRFGIQPTRAWDPATNAYGAQALRQADAYVFCLLHHQDKQTVDPLDLTQWKFYVLPAAVLNKNIPEQRGLSLSTLLKLGPTKAEYGEISAVLDHVFTA